MILFKTLFNVLYSFSYKTNKSIAEWSTIIVISILLTFNLISLLVLFDIPIQKIGKGGFKFIPLVFIGLNWLYFLKGSKYLKIIENPPLNKNRFYYNIIVIMYVLFSICFLFTTLNVDLKYLLYTIFFLTITMLIAYLKAR